MLSEEERVTAIGLCLQAESFLDTAEFCRKANLDGSLNVRFDHPTSFLLSHGIELTMKAWLRFKGLDLRRIKDLGHNLTKLYKVAKRNGLKFDEARYVEQWAERSPALHFIDSEIMTELQRVRSISKCRRDREYWRHTWLLGKLHGHPFVLRYQRTGLYKKPDIDFLLFCSLEMCSAVKKEIL